MPDYASTAGWRERVNSGQMVVNAETAKHFPEPTVTPLSRVTQAAQQVEGKEFGDSTYEINGIKLTKNDLSHNNSQVSQMPAAANLTGNEVLREKRKGLISRSRPGPQIAALPAAYQILLLLAYSSKCWMSSI